MTSTVRYPSPRYNHTHTVPWCELFPRLDNRALKSETGEKILLLSTLCVTICELLGLVATALFMFKKGFPQKNDPTDTYPDVLL
jgi:hypothetical protein